MADYIGVIAQIESAPSFDALQKIGEQYSAKATGDGGALYSGKVGTAKTGDFVAELQTHSSMPLIDRTQRAQLLSDRDVSAALREKAQELYRARGLDGGIEQIGL